MAWSYAKAYLKAMDKKVIEVSVRNMLAAIGEDPEREGLQETPGRVASAWFDLFSGYNQNPEDVFKTPYVHGFRAQ